MKTKPLLGPGTALLTVLLSISCILFFPSGGALKFEPDQLPDSRVGVAYEAEIHVTQNRTQVGDFAISKGALPAGLKLTKVEDVEDTAKISGAPEEAGTFTFTVSVWCYGTNVSGQTGEKEYTIVVEK
jgi:hypothetical protein